jgi:ATP-dependent DNA ligase
MLAKSGKLPTRGEWSYEVKWDGFRAIVSTEGSLRVRSRRGWDMTEHVRFLEQLPVQAVLDGELEREGAFRTRARANRRWPAGRTAEADPQ